MGDVFDRKQKIILIFDKHIWKIGQLITKIAICR